MQGHIATAVRLEKNKHMRDRLVYKGEKQIVLYEQANKKYHEAEGNLTDNMVKQAKVIVNHPNGAEWDNRFNKEGLVI